MFSIGGKIGRTQTYLYLDAMTKTLLAGYENWNEICGIFNNVNSVSLLKDSQVGFMWWLIIGMGGSLQ